MTNFCYMYVSCFQHCSVEMAMSPVLMKGFVLLITMALATPSKFFSSHIFFLYSRILDNICFFIFNISMKCYWFLDFADSFRG